MQVSIYWGMGELLQTQNFQPVCSCIYIQPLCYIVCPQTICPSYNTTAASRTDL